MNRFVRAGILVVLSTGCSTTPVVDTPVQPAASSEPAPRPQVGGALPANSEVVLRLNDRVGSDQSRVGDIFTAVVHEEVKATNGEVILPAGTPVTGMITGIDRSESAGDPAAIRLNFLRISVDKVTHPFTVDVVSTQLDAPAPPSTAAGAVLGTVLTKDQQHVLPGSTLGAGAGSIIALGNGEVATALPAGTRLVVRTRDRLEFR